MYWKPDLIERVKVLAKRGLSARQIGVEMGLSKGQVIGACYRNDIDLISQTIRMSPERRAEAEGRRRERRREAERRRRAAAGARPGKRLEGGLQKAVTARRPADAVSDRCTAPASSVDFWSLEPWHCRWPSGGATDRVDLTTLRFCASPVVEGCSYCHAHMEMAVSRRGLPEPLRTTEAPMLEDAEA